MLKSLLSLLLSKFYSKKESETVGHQSMPSNEKIDITAHPGEIESWTIFATYTTPTDGYVSIRAESYKNTAAIQISTGSEDKMPSIFTAANNPGEWLQTVIPVSKGVSVRLQGGGIKNVGSFFSKTIGGGYPVLKNALRQGGGLCLNSLSSSLRRSSWLTRRRGSATSLKPSYQGARMFPTPPALTNKITPLQVMELYALMSRVQNGLSCALRQILLGEFCNTLLSKKTLISNLFSPSQRARLSLSMSRLKEPPLVSSSFRPLVLNPAVGGASC